MVAIESLKSSLSIIKVVFMTGFTVAVSVTVSAQCHTSESVSNQGSI